MSQKRDYYEVLGVGRNASSDEIRKAYKQAALKYHPDRNPDDKKNAEGRFKEATEAFSALSDQDKRARYDQFGHAGLEGMGGFDFSGVDIFSHFQDLFADFFGGFTGGGRQRAASQHGADLRVQQRVSLKDAALGCKREISVRTPVPCKDCNGTGVEPGHVLESCPTCRGSGQVSSARSFVMFTSTCPSCRGQGMLNKHPCETCSGTGYGEEARKVVVTIPAGIDAGQRLRVPGQGAPGMAGAPSGDLYVDIDVEPDERFERDGTDLVTRCQVSFADAALGTTLHIPMLDGTTLDVDVSAGTQPGDVITLKGKGVARIDGRGKGALHVVVQVDVPKRISARARALLVELQKELQSSTEKRANAS